MTSSPVQFPLFTVRGNAYMPDQARLDLRVQVLDTMAATFGRAEVDEECPDCGEPGLAIALHPRVPVAYCTCGWFLEINR